MAKRHAGVFALAALTVAMAACGTQPAPGSSAAAAPSPTNVPSFNPYSPLPAPPRGSIEPQPVPSVQFTPFSNPSPQGTYEPPALAPGDWRWFDPRADAALDRKPDGSFVISAPDGNDLWPDYNFDAPRLVREVSGDFTLVARVRADAQTIYNGAGLVAQAGPATLVRLERGNPQGKNGVGLTAYQDGRFVKSGGGIASQATDLYLKLVREGTLFSAYARTPDQADWQRVGALSLELPPGLSVGPALVNQQNARRFEAAFSELSLARP
jgi:regulation of enolase protein 1 (concanavalin A-like superfamily)